MKKLILIFISALFICTIINAQYRINKTKYDYRTYSYQAGDPYNPSASALASFLIPGLGQMISGEDGRGFFFLCGYTVLFVESVSAIHTLNMYYMHHDWGFLEFFDQKGLSDFGIAAWWIFCAICLDISSVVDAVRVAKVNNLAFRDNNKTSFNLQIQPCFNPTFYSQTRSISPGITLKVRF